MRIKILYFTDKGKALSEKLKVNLSGHDAVIVPKGAPLAIVCGDAFVDNEALVFVGAAGIAVRAIAPLVRDKLKDPPVIVIDENGICIKDYPPEEPVDVLIADEEATKGFKDSAKIVLCPKRYAIGMGCRRGKSYEELRAFAEEVLYENGIDINDAGCIATIDVKKDEEGLKRLSQAWRMPLITFDTGLLAKVEGSFSHSETVLEKVGVDNVCERAAVLAAGTGAQLKVKKTARDGITVAVAERKL